MSDHEPTVSMTDEQVKAIAREAIAEYEESKKPKPEPRPVHKPGHYEAQPSSELNAVLLEAFDAAAKEGLNGDNQMFHVYWIIYGQPWTGGPGERVYHAHTPDERVTKLLEEWRGCPMTELNWSGRIAERSRVAEICRLRDLERKNPNYRNEMVAEMNRMYEGIAENSRWRDDARRPSDLTLEELEELIQAKRSQVNV